MKTTVLKSVAAVLALSLAASALAQAPSIPREISFQGKLTDTTGNPITTAVDLRFTLWDASMGGNSLWTETQANITPDGNGLYNVMLGGVTPFAVNFDNPYWLEVEVTPATLGNWESLSPRYQLSASPYAITAGNLEGLTATAAEINQALSGINIGGTVTAANLENLTDGSNADALHAHTPPTDVDTVDGIHASASATPGTLLALDGSGLFPVSVITQGTGSTLDADLLDGLDSTAFAAAGHTHATYVDLASAQTINGQKIFSQPIVSTVATGTAPFTIASTDLVANLNADQVDGHHASAFARLNAANTFGNFAQNFDSGTLYIDSANNWVGIRDTTPSYPLDVTGDLRVTGRLRSTVVTGTPPLAVSSITMVTNLNADRVDGQHANAFAQAAHTHNAATIDDETGIDFATFGWTTNSLANTNYFNIGSVNLTTPNHSGYLLVLAKGYIWTTQPPNTLQWLRIGIGTGPSTILANGYQEIMHHNSDGANQPYMATFSVQYAVNCSANTTYTYYLITSKMAGTYPNYDIRNCSMQIVYIPTQYP